MASSPILTVKRKDFVARVRCSRVLSERSLPGLVDVITEMNLALISGALHLCLTPKSRHRHQ
jgi:hypothetical protein